ncbi:MAG: Sensor histidine kinase RcsC [Thermoanaerobaculia bacterium]|nr:Sensor histidine kinase RcsC [Thermoanaerobaculia bacterium]
MLGQRFLLRLPLGRKLNAIVLLTTGLGLILFMIFFFVYDVARRRAERARDLSSLARITAATARPAVISNDLAALQSILIGVSERPEILFASIRDSSGRELARFSTEPSAAVFRADPEYVSGRKFARGLVTVWEPVLANGQIAGEVVLRQKLDLAREGIQMYALAVPLLLLTTMLAASWLSRRLTRLVTGPLKELALAQENVAGTRDFRLRIERRSDDELGHLTDGFNRVLQEVESREAELRIAMEKAEESSRTKSLFLANMSHELRTPLNAIIGYSEMLHEDAQAAREDALARDLSRINSAGRHLLTLINDILDISKIEAGRMELLLEDFDAPALVEEVAGMVRPLAARNGNEFTVACPAGIGILRADQTKLRQILFNLLSNAAKFCEKGKISLSVWKERGLAGERIHFRVSDTGIGMPEHVLGRLFSPFTQADASTTRKYGGTGLGLVISRRYCQMMGGDITVESRLGHGSTFDVSLPVRVSESGAAVRRSGNIPRVTDPVLRAAAGKAVPPSEANLVLVIDDDASLRDLLIRTLNKDGYRIVTAENGQEGLRLARELRPAAILLDIVLEGTDGWTVLSELKGRAETASIPVVILTMLDERGRGLELGAADYLMKPAERDQIVGCLRTVIRAPNPE